MKQFFLLLIGAFVVDGILVFVALKAANLA